MDLFIIITEIFCVIAMILDIITYEKNKKYQDEIYETCWKLYGKENQIREILLDAVINNEDAKITIEKIEKALVNDSQSKN